MQFTIASLVSLLLAAGVNAQFMINTPASAVQCQPLLLTWTGGQAPYFLSILPGGQPSATPIIDFGQQNSTSITWLVNIPSGTSVGLTLRDSTGALAQSAPFNILPSSDSGCLNETLSTSAGAAAPTNAQTTVSTGPATTTAASGAASGTTSRASSTGTAAGSGSTASSTNAAMANGAQIGFAGLVGAVLAAIVA